MIDRCADMSCCSCSLIKMVWACNSLSTVPVSLGPVFGQTVLWAVTQRWNAGQVSQVSKTLFPGRHTGSWKTWRYVQCTVLTRKCSIKSLNNYVGSEVFSWWRLGWLKMFVEQVIRTEFILSSGQALLNYEHCGQEQKTLQAESEK